MTTIAHVDFRDAQGETLMSALCNPEKDNGVIDVDGEISARTTAVAVRLEEVPLPEFGSPGALAQYRQTTMRELALDQMRRGLDITGAWDERVPRCNAPSPEGARCTLAAHHDRYLELAPKGAEQHERITDIRRPREVAEVWTDEPVPSQATKFLTLGHFTAWLVNDASCLDQPNCDITVLQDQLIGQHAEDRKAWGTDSSQPTVYHAVTHVPAADADMGLARLEAETLLCGAGWNLVDAWEIVDNAYIVTVERAI